MAKKVYYTIGEVAKILNVNTSAIRHWEKEFPELRSGKKTNNRRLYSEKDIEKIKFVHYLLKEKHYTIKGAKQVLRSNKKELQKEFEIISRLKKIRGFLEALREKL